MSNDTHWKAFHCARISIILTLPEIQRVHDSTGRLGVVGMKKRSKLLQSDVLRHRKTILLAALCKIKIAQINSEDVLQFFLQRQAFKYAHWEGFHIKTLYLLNYQHHHYPNLSAMNNAESRYLHTVTGEKFVRVFRVARKSCIVCSLMIIFFLPIFSCCMWA